MVFDTRELYVSWCVVYHFGMTYIIVGLGNPGEEYKDTRHNFGRMVVSAFAKAHDAPEFVLDKKIKALVASMSVAGLARGAKGEKVMLVMPETFMNNSGKAVGPLVTTAGKVAPKKAEKLIVVYDDFNLPLGTIKISFNRSSGGHNGLESVIKAVKTEAFVRVRMGVSPETAGGKIKIPHGEQEVEKFILGSFKPSEFLEVKKVITRAIKAIECVIGEGREKAMTVYNQN